MFYVATGVIRAMIYRTQVTVAEGGFLMVPRGNQYKIENISDVDDARLVFMQGREVPIVEQGEEGGEETEEQPDEEEGQEEAE
jgi:centromere protein C